MKKRLAVMFLLLFALAFAFGALATTVSAMPEIPPDCIEGYWGDCQFGYWTLCCLGPTGRYMCGPSEYPC